MAGCVFLTPANVLAVCLFREIVLLSFLGRFLLVNRLISVSCRSFRYVFADSAGCGFALPCHLFVVRPPALPGSDVNYCSSLWCSATSSSSACGFRPAVCLMSFVPFSWLPGLPGAQALACRGLSPLVRALRVASCWPSCMYVCISLFGTFSFEVRRIIARPTVVRRANFELFFT